MLLFLDFCPRLIATSGNDRSWPCWSGEIAVLWRFSPLLSRLSEFIIILLDFNWLTLARCFLFLTTWASMLSAPIFSTVELLRVAFCIELRARVGSRCFCCPIKLSWIKLLLWRLDLDSSYSLTLLLPLLPFPPVFWNSDSSSACCWLCCWVRLGTEVEVMFSSLAVEGYWWKKEFCSSASASEDLLWWPPVFRIFLSLIWSMLFFLAPMTVVPCLKPMPRTLELGCVCLLFLASRRPAA